MPKFNIKKDKTIYTITFNKKKSGYYKYNNQDWLLKNLKSIFKQIISQHKTIKFCNLYNKNYNYITENIIDCNNELNYYIIDYYNSASVIKFIIYIRQIDETRFIYKNLSSTNFIKSLCKLFVLKLF